MLVTMKLKEASFVLEKKEELKGGQKRKNASISLYDKNDVLIATGETPYNMIVTGQYYEMTVQDYKTMSPYKVYVKLNNGVFYGDDGILGFNGSVIICE